MPSSSRGCPAAKVPGSRTSCSATAAGEVNHDFRGKLSFSWPRDATQTTLNRNDGNYTPLFRYGFGLTSP